MKKEHLEHAKRLDGIASTHNSQFKRIKERIDAIKQAEFIESREGKEDMWCGHIKIDGFHFTYEFAIQIYEKMLDYSSRTAKEAEAALEAF